MKSSTFVLASVLVSLPNVALSQHSHGGPRPNAMPRTERPRPEQTTRPGLLPPKSPRGIEVLVLDDGFSPGEIAAEVGEEIVLLVRRSSAALCASGLEVPSRGLKLELPPDQTVPIPLKIERAESIELRCAVDGTRAVVLVAPR